MKHKTPAERLEIGAQYELGKTLTSKALTAKHGISRSTLAAFAAEYREKNSHTGNPSFLVNFHAWAAEQRSKT